MCLEELAMEKLAAIIRFLNIQWLDIYAIEICENYFLNDIATELLDFRT